MRSRALSISAAGAPARTLPGSWLGAFGCGRVGAVVGVEPVESRERLLELLVLLVGDLTLPLVGAITETLVGAEEVVDRLVVGRDDLQGRPLDRAPLRPDPDADVSRRARRSRFALVLSRGSEKTMSKRILRRAALVALAATAVVATGLPVAAQDDEEPQATEIGITPDEIRVAVVADVDSPLAPGQFQSQVDAVNGYAEFVNKRGGIAGRKLVVDFIDSKLNPDESRNATIKACAEDFAMVGTAAVFLTNVDDMVECVDMQGNPTGLPDINTFSQEIPHQCSPVSYSVSPPQLDCATKDQPVKTYRASLGQIRWYKKQDKDLHGICVGPNDLKSTSITGRVHCAAAEKLGVKLDGEGFYGISGRAPQTAMTPIVGAAKASNANYFNTLLGFGQVISMRKEAKLQGLNSVEVWDCSRSCYSREFLEQGGPDVEGQYTFLNTLPLEEAKHNKRLRQYINAVGEDKADAFGATAWAAAILFHEAIDQIVERDGINGITRAKLLEELSKVEDFDAGGMLAPTDVGARVPSECYFLGQVQNGEYVRVHPKKPGTFDCHPKNLVTVEIADE